MNQNLTQARKELMYTQQQIANMVNIDRSTYAHYERGRRPHLHIAFRLSQVLNKTVDELFLSSYVLK